MGSKEDCKSKKVKLTYRNEFIVINPNELSHLFIVMELGETDL